jgi:heme/copper-type cytochrome/quinol oxidase subunit 2
MRFWLPHATTQAAEVDYLIFALVVGSCAILGLVYGSITLYAIRYRAGGKVDRSSSSEKSWRLEVAWTSKVVQRSLLNFKDNRKSSPPRAAA